MKCALVDDESRYNYSVTINMTDNIKYLITDANFRVWGMDGWFDPTPGCKEDGMWFSSLEEAEVTLAELRKTTTSKLSIQKLRKIES